MSQPSASRASESENVFHFTPRADRKAAENMAEFIRFCRHDLAALGSDLPWQDWKWLGVGMFTKQGAVKGGRTSTVSPSLMLDPSFIGFAKAYVRYRHSQNPSESDSHHTTRLLVLRTLERALLECKSDASPAGLDFVVLDKSSSLARSTFSKSTAYAVGRELERLAVFVSSGLVPVHLGSWKCGIKSPENMGGLATKEGAAHRASRLPNPEVLIALAEIFNHELDSRDPAHQRDIYTTSVTALLLSAPSRGTEIHLVPANLDFEETDKDGDLHLGMRLNASKGFGHYIKWVWAGMAPVARIAFDRVRSATEEARALARWLEDPKTNSTFFRHEGCPDVDEDQPLTTEQAMQALGFAHRNSLGDVGLSSRSGTHTLRTLWNDWVVERQPENFPYVDKKKTIKYSEALFCMRRYQLHPNAGTSPVMLWAPSLTACYSRDLGEPSVASTNIFERHGYVGGGGKALRMSSHQLRHLLNTEAQRGGMSQEEIAKWSGRVDLKQNRVYNDMSEQERVDRARDALQVAKVPSAATDAAKHWDVRLKQPPSSCADLDLTPRGANHITVYGHCEHDFLFSPCENFGDCLNCKEHHCVKGAGKDDQERLARIKLVLVEVAKETAAAEKAMNEGDCGADKWHADHSRYLARLRELVSILESKTVSDGATVRLRGGNSQTHLHRVLRGMAMKALEGNSAPRAVIEQMMKQLEEEAPGVLVYANPALGHDVAKEAAHGAQ